MTYKMLSAARLKYTEEIAERIDFVITDSTEHNLCIIESVCAELETESVPDSHRLPRSSFNDAAQSKSSLSRNP